MNPVELSLARINYDIRTAQVWALYAQRVVAGVLPVEARKAVDNALFQARLDHPACDVAYCDAYEAHVKRTFGRQLRLV
jgi:hypothetical protein